jgi:hypothetical protein
MLGIRGGGYRYCPYFKDKVETRVLIEGYAQIPYKGGLAKRRKVVCFKDIYGDDGCGHEWYTSEIPGEMLGIGSSSESHSKRGKNMGREVQTKSYTAEDAIPRIQSEQFREQVKRCLAYPEEKLKKVEIQAGNRTYSYYTCGQDHDRRNPNWRPFKNLEVFCKKEKTCMQGFLSGIEGLIGRTFDCECEMLNSREEVARIRLAAAFGIDFAQKNRKRDCDVI